MSEEPDDDKPFEPSQKKLDDARAKGEIAKSNDLTTAAAYAGLLIVLLAAGGDMLIRAGSALMSLLDQADEFGEVIFGGSPSPLVGGAILVSGLAVLPIFAVPGIAAILSLIVQKAVVFTPTKLIPKPQRISPLAGAKNKFGRQGLFEFVKSLTKLIIYSAVLGVFLTNQIDEIVGTVAMSPATIAKEMSQLLVTLLALVWFVAVSIGAIDFIWQHKEHNRKHRMSRKEMLDEAKHSEGDPVMKQKRREKGAQIALAQLRVEVPKADVVIVNPTHYAVALAWQQSDAGAPVCVAKGVDKIAATIREIALENGVPLHSDPPTARALHASIEVGEEIRPDHYAAVAIAIRFAADIRLRASTS